MQLVDPLRAAATHVTRLVVVDFDGRSVGWIPTQAGADGFEIPRADLSTVLTNAARDSAEYLYDETVTATTDDVSGVDVTFRS